MPSKEDLKTWYFVDKLSTWGIEKKYGYHRSTIYRKLKEYGIAPRDRAEAHIIFPRTDFSEDLLEKAYLIGFRIGDLGVRRIYANSRTICVASGSTVQEQIDLLECLFEKYGKVWVKKTKHGKINVQVNLNETFSFLLSKDVPDWISSKKDYFFAFLAGFSDAEGSYGIYDKKTKFQLGNCRKDILLFIRDKLGQFDIVCRGPQVSYPNRYYYSYGRKEYFQISVNRKDSLLQLFKDIKPYIKHINKIKDLNKAESNILERMNTVGERLKYETE